MIELTLSSSQLQFAQFLLERFGIEGTNLTVEEARAATRCGSAWEGVVDVWKKRCPLEPAEDSFVKLRQTLMALKKEASAAAPPAEPKAPPSPGTQLHSARMINRRGRQEICNFQKKMELRR